MTIQYIRDTHSHLLLKGVEFKGHFHQSEIEWMHPHPKQKLKDEHVEAIETIEAEIHERGPYFYQPIKE